MKKFVLSLALLSLGLHAEAQGGGIDAAMLSRLQQQTAQAPTNRILRNALASNAINDLALTADNPALADTHFSHSVPSVGVTDQKSSGRCWLFTGLNVMRSKAIQRFGLDGLMLSQSYVFFYDQLEKSNLFLQTVIDKANEPFESQFNQWLFQHPLSDGGQFTGIQDLVQKYGIVPATVMPESFNANNTSRLSSLLQLKLREYGLELRKLVASGAKADKVQARKEEMLATVYRILAVTLGTPPQRFTYTARKQNGDVLSSKEYTPLSFYEAFVGKDLQNDYVMLMNDPSRPFHKTYRVEMDRHVYDGHDWTYINLPMEEIEAIAIASIKDSTMIYMSCDVGKQYNSKTGILSLDNYDYGTLFSTTFPMDKADRIRTYASASSHAMTMMAVDLDAQGQPLKWKVENSWGPSSGVQGHLIMTRDWLREYLFRLVPEKKYVPAATLRLLQQEPEVLPAWDPLFAIEEK